MTLSPSISGTYTFSDIVQSHGYRLTPASAAKLPSFTEDLFLVLQFGGNANVMAEGASPIAVDCTVRVRGSYAETKTCRWMMRKSFFTRFNQRKAELTFLLDAAVAGDLAQEHFQQRLTETVNHVQSLVADARSSLLSVLAKDKNRVRQVGVGPAVHIETIVIGDLIAGRCGLLKSSGSSFDRDELLRRIQVCDALEHDIIPDVASALRACASVIEPSFMPIREDAMFDGSLPDL